MVGMVSAFKSAAKALRTAPLRRFAADEGGSMVVYAATLAPVLIGAAGLAVDATSWHAQSRMVRTMADSAAMAAALEIARVGPDAAQSAAESAAGLNGFQLGADTIVVNSPPASGGYTGSDAVEVIVRRPTPRFFSFMFAEEDVTVAARAVAQLDSNNTCVFSLNDSDSGALSIAGGADVELPCGVAVNSSSSSAIVESGATSCLTASQIQTVGDYSGDCLVPAPITGASAVSDPFASVPPPSYGACDHNSKFRVNGGQTRSVDPGHYCKGIEVHAGGRLNMNAGLYILGGGFTVNGGATVVGDGVTIFIADTVGPSDNVNFAGGADIDLRAPSTGAYAGILFFQEATTEPGMNLSLIHI